MTREDAVRAATSTQQKHPVFKSITVVDGGKDWDYDYTIQRKTEDGPAKAVEDELSSDEGTISNPLELTWPKPYSAQYPTLYFGGKTKEQKSQADLKAQIGQTDETGEVITAYQPHNQTALPGGEIIGIASKFQIASGKTIGPLSQKTSPGGSKMNRVLARYGFSPRAEGLDADHIVEIQLGGSDIVPNLWPLDRSTNRASGSIINSTEVVGLKTGVAKKISDLKKDTSRKYYFKIR